MNAYLLVALGGAIGAVLRFACSQMVGNDSFPLATLSVNLLGSFLIGFCTLASANAVMGEEATLLLITGILGAFTTMSAFSLETIQLIEQRDWSSVLPYIGITLFCCPLLAFFGLKTGEYVFTK